MIIAAYSFFSFEESPNSTLFIIVIRLFARLLKNEKGKREKTLLILEIFDINTSHEI